MRMSMTLVVMRTGLSVEGQDLYQARRRRVIGMISQMTFCRRRGKGVRGYGARVGGEGKGIDETCMI